MVGGRTYAALQLPAPPRKLRQLFRRPVQGETGAELIVSAKDASHLGQQAGTDLVGSDHAGDGDPVAGNRTQDRPRSRAARFCDTVSCTRQQTHTHRRTWPAMHRLKTAGGRLELVDRASISHPAIRVSGPVTPHQRPSPTARRTGRHHNRRRPDSLRRRGFRCGRQRPPGRAFSVAVQRILLSVPRVAARLTAGGSSLCLGTTLRPIPRRRRPHYGRQATPTDEERVRSGERISWVRVVANRAPDGSVVDVVAHDSTSTNRCCCRQRVSVSSIGSSSPGLSRNHCSHDTHR